MTLAADLDYGVQLRPEPSLLAHQAAREIHRACGARFSMWSRTSLTARIRCMPPIARCAEPKIRTRELVPSSGERSSAAHQRGSADGRHNRPWSGALRRALPASPRSPESGRTGRRAARTVLKSGATPRAPTAREPVDRAAGISHSECPCASAFSGGLRLALRWSLSRHSPHPRGDLLGVSNSTRLSGRSSGCGSGSGTLLPSGARSIATFVARPRRMTHAVPTASRAPGQGGPWGGRRASPGLRARARRRQSDG